MSFRYQLPDPLCHHARTGIVAAGGGPGEAHAATSVCSRPGCITDAIEWVAASTGLTPTHQEDNRG